MADLSKSAARVQQALDAKGVALKVRELPGSTRTCEDAAASIGCEVARIAKSLVLQGKKSGEAFMVVASGTNRVDLKAMKGLLGEQVRMAPPEFVREVTGYAIGGVPPLGHATKLRTLVDRDLLDFESVFAAAGTPHAMFELTGRQLVDLTGAELVALG